MQIRARWSCEFQLLRERGRGLGYGFGRVSEDLGGSDRYRIAYSRDAEKTDAQGKIAASA